MKAIKIEHAELGPTASKDCMHPNVAKTKSLQLPQYEKYKDEPPGEGRGVVYAVVNKIDGMTYVGKHIHGKTGKSVSSTRWKIHQSKHGFGCRRFYNALQKHGPEGFEWFIIEHVPEELVAEYESFHISEYGLDTLNPRGYNLVDQSTSGLCSEETCKRISEAAKARFTDPKERKKHSDRATRVQNTDEHRANMSSIKMQGREALVQKRLLECEDEKQKAKVVKYFNKLDAMNKYHAEAKTAGIKRVPRGSPEHMARIRAKNIEKRNKQLAEADPMERTVLESHFARLDERSATRKKTWRK